MAAQVARSLVMHVKRPFVEKPLIPEQRNDSPEVPYQRFAVGDAFSQVGHVVTAQGPMAEVGVVKEAVEDRGGSTPLARKATLPRLSTL